jgi:outer membrane beta-barrel protein
MFMPSCRSALARLSRLSFLLLQAPRVLNAALVGSVLLCGAAAQAQGVAPEQPQTATPPSVPVIDPQIARREVKVPKFPSRDLEVGLVFGSYSTQNFGARPVVGVRLGYHVTEDFFVLGQYGRSRVSDEAYRQVLPGGVLANGSQNLQYATVTLGYNLLPGEVFFGRNQARLSQGYLLAGMGLTQFAGQRKQTIDVGFGLRVFLTERWSVNAEVRDHIFPLDILGKRQNTQNTEVTLGISTFF